jgi:ankyrin repeat protein
LTGSIHPFVTALGSLFQVDARDNYQFTPLHSAANGGHVGAVERLAALGHDLNARDYLGRTPLHYAAMHGRLGVLEALLRLGADLAQKDLRGGYTGAAHGSTAAAWLWGWLPAQPAAAQLQCPR